MFVLLFNLVQNVQNSEHVQNLGGVQNFLNRRAGREGGRDGAGRGTLSKSKVKSLGSFSSRRFLREFSYGYIHSDIYMYIHICMKSFRFMREPSIFNIEDCGSES